MPSENYWCWVIHIQVCQYCTVQCSTLIWAWREVRADTFFFSCLGFGMFWCWWNQLKRFVSFLVDWGGCLRICCESCFHSHLLFSEWLSDGNLKSLHPFTVVHFSDNNIYKEIKNVSSFLGGLLADLEVVISFLSLIRPDVSSNILNDKYTTKQQSQINLYLNKKKTVMTK